MRVSNVNYNYNQNVARPAVLGVNPTSPREIAFRIIDENGNHIVNPGKKFPFTISNMTWRTGAPLQAGAITGVALSEAETPSSSVVRITINVPQDVNNLALQDVPVDATLTLYGVYGGAQYPIFENRTPVGFVPPWSPVEPLNLKAIYGAIQQKKDAAVAQKYAEDAALDLQSSIENYNNGLESEAQAAAAAEKARLAAEQAAASKAASDKAAKDAEDARLAALGEASSRNKAIMWAVGGLAALGVISYFAFAPSGK